MKNLKNIGIVSMHPPGSNGVGTTSWNIALMLKQNGFNVFFITSKSFSSDQKNPVNVITLHGKISLKSIQWSIHQRIASIFPNLFQPIEPTDIDLIKFAKQISTSLPQIISNNKITNIIFSESFLEYIFLPRIKGINISIRFACPKYLFVKTGLSKQKINDYLHKKEKLAVRQANNFFTPSKIMASFASDYYNIPIEKIKVIPTPIDTEKFHPPKNFSHLKNNPAICFVGRFSKEKGAEAVIQIIPKLLKKHPILRFSIAGETGMSDEGTPYLNILLNLLKKNKTAKQFSHNANIPHHAMSDFLKQHNILFLPSLFDNYSVAIAESQSCGLCVVAAGTGGTPELIKNQENGFLSDPFDYASMTNQLEILIKSPQLRSKIGQQARLTRVNTNSYNNVFNKIIEYLH